MPPAVTAVNTPVLPPLHGKSVGLITAFKGAGVPITACMVSVHPLLSVTTTVYAPALRLILFAGPGPPGVQS